MCYERRTKLTATTSANRLGPSLDRYGMAMRYSLPCLRPESMSPQEKALYSLGEVYNTVSRASAVIEA
jgi:hypothetical protein